MNIFVVKESRAGETRVALVPDDVKDLKSLGHHIVIEKGAGEVSGFSDESYDTDIRENHGDYNALFSGIDCIVRVKRPNREREIAETEAVRNVIMVGALDPFEKNATHIDAYHKAHITAYSIDQLDIPRDDPMNLLAAMSTITGKLAFLDALEKREGSAKNVLIVGFGSVGRAALIEARKHDLPVIVVLRSMDKAAEVESLGGAPTLLKGEATLLGSDIIITSARRNNEPAPLLFPLALLDRMQPGTVIVDLAISEGGNVEGSQHDATVTLGNGVIVTNTSGYPKALPREASLLWSRATKHFLEALDHKTLNINSL